MQGGQEEEEEGRNGGKGGNGGEVGEEGGKAENEEKEWKGEAKEEEEKEDTSCLHSRPHSPCTSLNFTALPLTALMTALLCTALLPTVPPLVFNGFRPQNIYFWKAHTKNVIRQSVNPLNIRLCVQFKT